MSAPVPVRPGQVYRYAVLPELTLAVRAVHVDSRTVSGTLNAGHGVLARAKVRLASGRPVLPPAWVLTDVTAR